MRLSAHGARGWLARGVWGHSPQKHQEMMSLGLRASQGMRWKVSFRTCRELWPQARMRSAMTGPPFTFDTPWFPPSDLRVRFHGFTRFSTVHGVEQSVSRRALFHGPFQGRSVSSGPGSGLQPQGLPLCGCARLHAAAPTGNILGILDPEGTGIKWGFN